MVSLVDIVPQKRTVQLAAGELELRGLGLRQIARLFVLCPSLRNFFVEGAPEVGLNEFVEQAPDAVGYVIAEAADQPGAADTIINGTALTAEEVLDCLLVIRDLTLPRGVSPLTARLEALLSGRAVTGPFGRGPDTNVPLEPNGLLPADMSLPQ
jgi:hypothetical protein